MNPIKYEQALHRLAAFCSRAERCRQDIYQKMNRWELPEGDREKIVRYLEKENFLDEKRFCRAFVNDKSKYNRWGTYKIRYELQKKQIPDALVREALSNVDVQENRERLRQLMEAKRKTVKGKNDYEIRQKLMRFAAGRGFPVEDINAVLGI